jgi:hypothetical protein
LERLADGAELVAIAGANGRGKTTVMDNMHPLCRFRRVNVGSLSPFVRSFSDGDGPARPDSPRRTWMTASRSANPTGDPGALPIHRCHSSCQLVPAIRR